MLNGIFLDPKNGLEMRNDESLIELIKKANK